MKENELPEAKGVQYFKAKDGRVVGIFIKGDFEDYEKFPPYVESESEKAFLSKAYSLEDQQREKFTKAHVTPENYPLQLTILNREPGATTKPHYHEIFENPKGTLRQQILWCQRGKARVGIYTKEGDHLGDVILENFGLVFCNEGHEVEFLEPNTKLIEVKQGPIPVDMGDEMVVL
ncbi:hypothetical protein ACFLXB_00460 [Chloroflexota bacterium]